MRIGIFGGTFDPIHIAHLAIAEQALEQLELDKILFVPAWSAPHKQNSRATTLIRTQDRLAMLKLAIEDHPAFEISTLELDRKGTSYTVDTLEEIAKQYSEADTLFLLIGADNYAIFQQWRQPERILQLCQIGVYSRPGTILDSLPTDFVELVGPKFDLSSTWLRKQISIKKSVRYLVPEKVRHYIDDEKLYID